MPASDAESRVEGDSSKVRSTFDDSADLPAQSPRDIAVYNLAQDAHVTHNYFSGRAGDNAGAYGGNANFGDQNGATIRIGIPLQSTPTNQASPDMVSGPGQPTPYVHQAKHLITRMIRARPHPQITPTRGRHFVIPKKSTPM